MNEQIKKLAEQSGISRQYQEEYFGPKLLEQFAELIVKECANIAAEQSAIKPEYRIRRHFGVE